MNKFFADLDKKIEFDEEMAKCRQAVSKREVFEIASKEEWYKLFGDLEALKLNMQINTLQYWRRSTE